MNPLKVSQVYTLASFRVLVATLKTLFLVASSSLHKAFRRYLKHDSMNVLVSWETKKKQKNDVIGAKDSRLKDTKISSNEEEIVWRNEGRKKLWGEEEGTLS